MGNLVLLFLLSVLVFSPSVQGQDCARITATDLGDTAVASGVGLLADALTAAGGGPAMVQVLGINIVCEAQGSARDTYRSTSVVVQYMDMAAMTAMVQVESQCVGGIWGAAMLNMVPDADITTPTRTDCIICADPAVASGPIIGDSHCQGMKANNLWSTSSKHLSDSH